ncbi:MAG: hypothetical protein ACM3L9_05430 [Deltaproteobacteria bacterium]
MIVTSQQPAIHTLWVGSALGPLEQLCLASWVRLGYNVVLHCYDELPTPKGVQTFDAAKSIPRNRIFRNARNGSLAVFADVYRAMILKRFDALWLDADIFLLKAFDFSPPNLLAKEGGDDTKNLNNAVMRLSPDHPILDEILAIYQHPSRGLPWDRPGKLWQIFVQSAASLQFGPQHLPWGALGYIPIQRYVAQHGFDGVILESRLCLTGTRTPLFVPVNNPAEALGDPVVYIHFWGSQRKDQLSKPVPSSIYGLLCRTIGLNVP